MLTPEQIAAITQGRCDDPFALLGPHEAADGSRIVRTFQPGASSVHAVAGSEAWPLRPVQSDGLFEGVVGSSGPYQLRVRWTIGGESLLDDPYRFGKVLGDMDVWLLGEGSHLRPYEILGATPRTFEGVQGTSFAVWAPNARRASVVGDFNIWDGRRHPMRLRRECGVWEIFLPGVGPGARYKFELLDRHGHLLPQKADPYARQAELRPATASIVASMPPVAPPSQERQAANALDAPFSIYEVHLASWRRRAEEGNRWFNWDEFADELVPYVQDMGFTHIELLPVSEHPLRRPHALAMPPAFAASSTGHMRPGWACCWTGCRPISPPMPGAWRNSTARTCTNMPTVARASTTTGTPSSTTMAAPKCATSWSVMPCTGWNATTWTGCAWTPWPACCTGTTAAKPVSGSPTCTAAARTSKRLPSSSA
jgi:hypothetical protein